MKTFTKKLTLSCSLALALVHLHAQGLHYAASAGIGLSSITSSEATRTIDGGKVKLAGSANAGISVEKTLRSRSSLGVELLWMQMHGKEGSTDRPIFAYGGGEGVQIGSISEKLSIHSTYMALPLYYRLQLGKFGLKLGVQPLLFLSAHTHYESSGELLRNPIESRSRTTIEFDRFDFGPKLGLDYRFGRGFSVRADFYYGIPDIMKDDANFQRRNRQASVGMQYWFK